MLQEFYTSKHFTAEDIDERLLEGYYLDAVEAGYPGTKEQFLKQLANTISSESGKNESEGGLEYDPNAKITPLYGTDGKILYPLTTVEAIFDHDGKNLMDKLKETEEFHNSITEELDEVKKGGFIEVGSITTDKIAPEAVNKERLAEGAVTTSRIKDGAVELDKLSPMVRQIISTLERGTIRAMSKEEFENLNEPEEGAIYGIYEE